MSYDIIIIGAGPAGMTAAIYARRAAKSVLLLEAASYGGQIINAQSIENYPAEPHISGFDFATRLYEQTKALGAEFKFEKAVGIEDKGGEKLVTTPNGVYSAGAVIIATGSDKCKLGLENEDALAGRGVSYCAVCDGAFFRKKVVAVAGGSRNALEDALYLADIAERVCLIHRSTDFRGAEVEYEKLKERGNVEFIEGRVTKLIADKKLTAIEVTTRDGRSELAVDGLFVAIGRVPENRNFASVIELDEKGYAVAGEDCTTKTAGIFVAGDNRVKRVRQLVTAASDGATAATAAINYLRARGF